MHGGIFDGSDISFVCTDLKISYKVLNILTVHILGRLEYLWHLLGDLVILLE